MQNTTNQSQTTNPTTSDSKLPDWVVKTPNGSGRLERIGVAWNRDDNGLCVRLVGRQLIDQDLYIYPIKS